MSTFISIMHDLKKENELLKEKYHNLKNDYDKLYNEINELRKQYNGYKEKIQQMELKINKLEKHDSVTRESLDANLGAIRRKLVKENISITVLLSMITISAVLLATTILINILH